MLLACLLACWLACLYRYSTDGQICIHTKHTKKIGIFATFNRIYRTYLHTRWKTSPKSNPTHPILKIGLLVIHPAPSSKKKSITQSFPVAAAGAALASASAVGTIASSRKAMVGSMTPSSVHVDCQMCADIV